MESLQSFFSFNDMNVVLVLVGVVLLLTSSAIVGTFTFLKKKALVGDAVAHAVLPGICLAFMISGSKNPYLITIGAFITGWLSLVIIDYIKAKSKIKEDTAIALILSVFFGVGILLLTNIQQSGNAAQSGLSSFLFGNAAALVLEDLKLFGIVAIVLLLMVVLFFKELKLLIFDEQHAKALGLPVKSLNLLLTTLTVLAVVTGIQAVGVVLMAAMLITPAAAARFWTEDMIKMLILAALFGALSGVVGTFVSYTAPTMPTGPWIVMVISFIAIVSFFIAPKKGIIAKQLEQNQLQRTLLEENLLKAFYHLSEASKGGSKGFSVNQLIEKRYFPEHALKSGMKRLQRKKLLLNQGEKWMFTSEGLERGKRMVKLHRLWEMYLSTYLRIAPDHVHEDAETIEHIITPELEARLEKLLDYPDKDPHEQEIPY